MKQLILILLTSFFLIPGIYAKRIYVNPNRSVASQFHQKENSIFFISTVVDLNKGAIVLPSNSSLIFKKGGCLKNGNITFANTKIIRKHKDPIFDQCTFAGKLKRGRYYISMFGVKANGEYDDAPLINNVLSIINGCGCELFFDCHGDYGISTYKNRKTIMVGSNTTITFTGKGFLKLLTLSKLGAVLSLVENAHDIVINNIQIDGGGAGVISGNSGQNGIGAGGFRNFYVNGGIIRNCHKGKDISIEGVFSPGDGGKGIQIEPANSYGGVFKGIRIENCHAAISCHRNFQKKGGMDVVFSNIFGENCEQYAIIHQTNGEDITGEEQRVVVRNFTANNCGETDGVFIFSRTRFLIIENGYITGNVKTPAAFRGRISKSVINNVTISQPCRSVIDLNPSLYGNDQRESCYNYYNLILNNEYDYLISSNEEKKVPYRSMTKSVVSAICKENPQKSVYSSEVNSSGMLNIKLKLPYDKIFEGSTVFFDCEYGSKYERLNNSAKIVSRTEGTARLRPSDLTMKDEGYAFWNSDNSVLEIWNGNQWETIEK